MRNPGRREKTQERRRNPTLAQELLEVSLSSPLLFLPSWVPYSSLFPVCLLSLARSESLSGAKILKVSSTKYTEKVHDSGVRGFPPEIPGAYDTGLYFRVFRVFRDSTLLLSPPLDGGISFARLIGRTCIKTQQSS